MVSLRLRPRIRSGASALKSWHSTGVGVAALTVLVQVASYITLVLATVAVGASSAAALRGASSVMAPVNTLLSFLALGLLPAVHRVHPNRQLGMVARIALGILVLTALWCSVLLLTPPSIGELLLGDTWPLTRHILPWTSLEYLFVAVANTAILGFQARQAGRLLVNVGIGGAALMISTSVVAAFMASSATPFAIAQVVAMAIGTAVIWTICVRMMRRSPSV